MRVSELMRPETNGWNDELVRATFLAFEANSILNIRMGENNPRDVWCWDLTRDGNYSVKSAYGALSKGSGCQEEQSDYSREEWLWKRLWKVPVLPRIKVFFWQLCNDAIATRNNIARRIPGTMDGCPICGYDVESGIHIVRECSWVRSVWSGLGVDVLSGVGFDRIRDWIEALMRDKGMAEWVELMTGCWAIWEMRNKVVFDGVRWSVEDVFAPG
ncbi:uncharacterized protein LOC141608508 [Silene latifolia]|uniref:uncharacterized protein LOC141608508 n=1 Tax=Silene latifolia TaxID=37657 RepID=UPI003D7747EA